MPNLTFFSSKDESKDFSAEISEKYGIQNAHISAVFAGEIDTLKLINDTIPEEIFVQANITTLAEKLNHVDKKERIFIEFSQASEDTNLYVYGSKIPAKYGERGKIINRNEIDAEIQNKREEKSDSCIEIESKKLLGSTYFNLTHTVCMLIDNSKKEISYKDPYGSDMPEELQDYFKTSDVFKNHSISFDSTPQQHPNDHNNCKLLSLMNLKSAYKNEPFVSFPIEKYIKEIENLRSEIIKQIDEKRSLLDASSTCG